MSATLLDTNNGMGSVASVSSKVALMVKMTG
jgi:hypothetical protein